MLDPHPDITREVIWGLAWLYLILFLMNTAWTVRSYRRHDHFRLPEAFGGQDVPSAGCWALYAALLGMISIAHFIGGAGHSPASEFLIRMPEWFKDGFDGILGNGKLGPVLYFSGSVGVFLLLIAFRRQFAKPTTGWILLNVVLLFMALSMTDWDFRQIVGKPDNVPIVSIPFIVGFFTWLYFNRSVENDDRIAEGRPLKEEEDNPQILVWPDLVYTELITMVVLTVVLIVWGIVLQAPLEEPASSSKTPNPSKAPWYFLGLQEMLVYFDPWLAGVVFPSLIIVGLMAIPYIDFNKKGNGYYTFNERKTAVSLFLFGFLPLWLAMIVLGTFLRGPNWNIFGPYEYWDTHKLEALNNIDLSDYFWVDWLNQGLPTPDPDASALSQTATILKREAPGIVVVLGYLLVLPPLMAATVFRRFFQKMGFVRYMVFVNLLLIMAALPIKMVLRWSFNLKYIVSIPEWFFNI